VSSTLHQITIADDATLLEGMGTIDRCGHGIAFVRDDAGKVLGTLTDGDIRRAILSGASPGDRCLRSALNEGFVWVDSASDRAAVLDIMRARSIDQIPVLDKRGRLIGLHLLKELIGAAKRLNWAVILAGGKGSRLAPLTEAVPKPMLHVAGRPVLERLVLHVVGFGIRRVFLAVNHLAHVIEEHFEDGTRFGCDIEYLRETTPLGSGGPLSLLPAAPEASILVMNGDLVTQANLALLFDAHDAGGFAATCGLRPHAVEIAYCVARVDGDRLLGFKEKPTEQLLVNAGIYVVSPEAVSLVPSNRQYHMTALIQRCLEEGRPVGAHLIEDEWADIGHPHELSAARGL
jgi:dTDP-glucose pyrophosphorylase